MRQIKTLNYVRITKKQAERRYNTKQEVYILPCNLNPENVWQKPALIKQNGLFLEPFENVVNHFIYYNCDRERGKYPAYYISREEYEERKQF